MTQDPIWSPDRKRLETCRMTDFMRWVKRRQDHAFADYAGLYDWSVSNTDAFWDALWDYTGIIASQRGDRIRVPGTSMEQTQWYPEARLNYAENLLDRGEDSQQALAFWDESGRQCTWTRGELREAVGRMAHALKGAGISPGDRVAGYMPNMPETVIAMLATTALGAVWSSCSPDFGADGALDRFGQIEPRVLVTADGYYYNGKTIDSLDAVSGMLPKLPSVEHTVVVPYVQADCAIAGLPGAVSLWKDFLSVRSTDIPYEPVPFNHPLFILFSSGTTGVPKCIVHGHGGTLLQHLKEHQLHTDLSARDVLFYYTTTGWMMWNWLVSGLASEATLVLYDGAPTAPSISHLWDMAEQEQVTVFGTSARYIAALQKAEQKPAEAHDLSALKTILSTGSPLLPEHFDYVYEAVKKDVLLGSISGGTDILSCFALSCPVRPVYRGELQCRGLGMAVDMFDESGNPVRAQKGELVCRVAFPSMPVGFWNDPNGERFHDAYFSRFPGVWAHGDYGEITAQDGVILYGRSDAVLNPGGVRIGTAEIYRQVEKVEDVLESVAIGQPWDGTERVVLFVRLRDGITLDDALEQLIRQTIRASATPRHVPAVIRQVPDIPRTQSGKIVEIAVKKAVLGEPVPNRSALANPDALTAFQEFSL